MQFDASLRERVRHNLQTFDLHTVPVDGQRAAVALVLTEEGWGAALDGLPQPSQWALPGGRVEPGESATDAALRELHEEIGLQLAPDAVLGRLDDFSTRSGFAITPVVVWAGAATAPLVPNPAEVASIHRVPVQEFMRSDAPMLEPIDDSPHPVLRMPVGQGWIAAPTAALLYQFREVCIAGRSTRVAHYEQPLFARR